MAHAVRFRRESQTEFSKAFRPLSERQSAWQAWADFVDLAAISIYMPFGVPGDEKHKQRKKEYMSIVKRYTPAEIEAFSKLFSMTVDALEDNPEQDFLGEMFMMLDLSNHWKGQFFTPYDLCKCIAKMTLQDIGKRIEAKGWVGICDCCCGAGALLIAARNVMHFSRPPIGHLPGHQQVLFACQDVDRVAGLMCYIQLSLPPHAATPDGTGARTDARVFRYGDGTTHAVLKGGEVVKHGKNLTRSQKKAVAAAGLNPDNWLAVKNTNQSLVIIHRLSGKTRTIERRTK